LWRKVIHGRHLKLEMDLAEGRDAECAGSTFFPSSSKSGIN
jgi:hypothetical protein